MGLKGLSIHSKPKEISGTPMWYLIATLGGIGELRPASGTWGSLAALPAIVIALISSNPAYYLGITLALTVIFSLFSIWATDRYLKTVTTESDPKSVVIDEAAGLALAFSTVTEMTMTSAILAFVLFRLFDAIKPWPISWFDRNIKGAFGVLFDDLLAGLFTAVILFLILPLL